MRRMSVLLLVFLGSLSATLFGQRRPDPLKGLDQYIERAMHDWNVPGLAIAIVKDDSVVYARGFGVREIGKPGRVDENTLFAVASNTKAFTATAVTMLAVDNKLSLNDPVTRYLPDWQLSDPWATREATLRDLLTHRMGYLTWQGDLVWYGSTYDRAEVIRRMRYLKPAASFRSAYGYSNYGFLTAGEIVAKVSGVSWDEFVRSHFFAPLGMTRTSTSLTALAGMDNVAMPHTRIDDSIVVVPYRNVDNAGGAATINSSVADMSHWLRLQLANGVWNGHQLVDSTAIRLTRTPQFTLPIGSWTRAHFPSTHFSSYGLGFFLRDYRGHLLVMHDGGMDGMLSQLGMLPEEHLGVIILTNYDDQTLFQALLFRVLDLYLGAPVTDWSQVYFQRDRGSPAEAPAAPIQGTHPSLDLAGYAGRYTNPLYGAAEVSVDGGQLHIALLAHPRLAGTLEHWQYDTFRATLQDRYVGKPLVTFSLDEMGRVSEFRVSIRPDFVDPLEYVFERQRP
ncbi:MAG TPA: serine hydrolase [Gemmatimonadales bacterium]|nr:serine hydrolase [Gemmatimonadales bacterium]